MGGIFEMRRKARIQFKLPEFSHNKTITWNVHVDEHTTPADAQYNMIIGTDLMEELQINIDYNRCHIKWDDIIVPMRSKYCPRTNAPLSGTPTNLNNAQA